MKKVARAVTFSLAAAALGFSPIFAQTPASPAPPQAASAAGAGAKIVPVEGSLDGDLTLEGFEGIACAYLYSEEVVSVGPVFGDAEKDTLARTVVGTDCR